MHVAILTFPGLVIARLAGIDAAATALHYVAPVGEKDEFFARALDNVAPYLPDAQESRRA